MGAGRNYVFWLWSVTLSSIRCWAFPCFQVAIRRVYYKPYQWCYIVFADDPQCPPPTRWNADARFPLIPPNKIISSIVFSLLGSPLCHFPSWQQMDYLAESATFPVKFLDEECILLQDVQSKPARICKIINCLNRFLSRSFCKIIDSSSARLFKIIPSFTARFFKIIDFNEENRTWSDPT